MARQTLTKTTAPGHYATAGVKVTLTAAIVADKEQFVSTGKELVLAQNTGGEAYTVTINSTADDFGRTGDITTHSIHAGEVHAFGPFPLAGWKQATSSYIFLEASNAAVKFAVIVLP
jgi:hypothetical protein